MKLLSLLAITGLFLLMPLAVYGSEEHFSVKEYNKFHDVLHPLQHEALPNKDWARIRSNSGEFVKRGKAIVKVGVPAGVPKTKAEEFRKELKKFNTALNKFNRDAKSGGDGDLEASFAAVHDSFEMLVGLLPPR
jgi:hypothetical protein